MVPDHSPEFELADGGSTISANNIHVHWSFRLLLYKKETIITSFMETPKLIGAKNTTSWLLRSCFKFCALWPIFWPKVTLWPTFWPKVTHFQLNQGIIETNILTKFQGNPGKNEVCTVLQHCLYNWNLFVNETSRTFSFFFVPSNFQKNSLITVQVKKK